MAGVALRRKVSSKKSSGMCRFLVTAPTFIEPESAMSSTKTHEEAIRLRSPMSSWRRIGPRR